MYQDKRIVALIPARGGSKGVPNKNILLLGEKPLVHWTIDAAMGCPYLDEVVVSTDSEEIAKVCAGTRIIERPAGLAEDGSSLTDVAIHANLDCEYVLVLQPTSPFRTTEHISAMIEWFFATKSSDKDERMVSVSPVSRKYGWLMRKGGEYFRFCFDYEVMQRQDFPQFYIPNGAMYLLPKTGINEGFYYKALGFIMEESLDIDTQEDFYLARSRLTTTTNGV